MDPTVKKGEALITIDDLVVGNPDSDTSAPAHVVLVSHQPLVSQLVDYFLDTAGSVPSLSPGALVTFELSSPARACGELRFWAVPPEYQAGV